MYLLLSGEGKGDLGCCLMGLSYCLGTGFIPGPMAWFVDQLIENEFDFSHIDSSCCGFIPETELTKISKKFSKPVRFPGKKQKQETGFFYKNAQALAQKALALQEEQGDQVLAVLFRDADRTRSTNRGEWQVKWDSMINGFSSQGYDYGVPMLPDPKSEAWLLCAVKNDPYQHCEKLEKLSGNDDSPEPLKSKLAQALDGSDSSEEISQMVKDKDIDIDQINMTSVSAFKEQLNDVIQKITSQS